MSSVKSGSLMIELLLYIMLSALVMVGAMSWFSRSYHSLASIGQSSNALMALYSAMDILVRDLRTTSCMKQDWKMRSSESIIWHTEDGDIGWELKGKNLYRVKGSYDVVGKKWKNKRRTLILQKSETLFNFIEVNNVITSIECDIATGMHRICEQIYPRKLV